MTLTDVFAAVQTPDFYRSVASVVLTICVSWIARLFQPAAKIAWGESHGHVFNVFNNSKCTQYHTRSIFVQNIGSDAAKDIEIHLNYKPEHYEIWPSTVHKIQINPDNRFIIEIPSLGKKREWFNIELLSTAPLPQVLRVRTPYGECNNVPLAPMQVFNKKVIFILRLLVLIGIYTVCRWIIDFVSFIYLNFM